MKLFRGKGRFSELFYCYSYYTIAIYVFNLVAISLIALLILLIGPIAGILYLPAAIYILHLLSVLLMEVGEYSRSRAFLTWFIPTMIIIGLFIVSTLIFGAILRGMIGSLPSF